MSDNHADVSGKHNPMAGKFGKDNPKYIKFDMGKICKIIKESRTADIAAAKLGLNTFTLRNKLQREYNTSFMKIKKGDFTLP